MEPSKQALIEFILSRNVLQFGNFTLKSGRQSPFFFNAGQLHYGEDLQIISSYFAEAIEQFHRPIDTLFGPAYKGIPLVSSCAMTMMTKFNKNYPYSFNRKEKKQHGEQGLIVGAPIQNNVLLIDDVITAGTAIRESADFIVKQGGSIAGILVLLDRQEQGQHNQQASQELSETYDCCVQALLIQQDLMEYTKTYQPKTFQMLEKHQKIMS